MSMFADYTDSLRVVKNLLPHAQAFQAVWPLLPRIHTAYLKASYLLCMSVSQDMHTVVVTEQQRI
jgi:hypothetical protein